MRLLPLILLAACTGDVEFPGTDMTNFFELENNIDNVWQYVNVDQSLRYTLTGEIENYEVVTETGTEYTIVWRTDCIQANDPECDDDLEVRSMIMTSDFRGINIHAVDGVRFDAPVLLSAQLAKVGDVVTSTSDGVLHTSTYTQNGDCQDRLSWEPNCPQFDVTAPTPTSVTGTYWTASRFNIVAFDVAGQPGRWEITNVIVN